MSIAFIQFSCFFSQYFLTMFRCVVEWTMRIPLGDLIHPWTNHNIIPNQRCTHLLDYLITVICMIISLSSTNASLSSDSNSTDPIKSNQQKYLMDQFVMKDPLIGIISKCRLELDLNLFDVSFIWKFLFIIIIIVA